jgi:hypothetical protein
VFRVFWIALIVLLVAGGLTSLTLFLGWRQYVLLALMGFLAGLAVLVVMLGSVRNRELTSLILGTVTLPLLAVYLGGVAARDTAAFTTYSASLLPFLVHATGVVLGGVWISRIWQRRPARPAAESPGQDAGAPSRSEGAVP